MDSSCINRRTALAAAAGLAGLGASAVKTEGAQGESKEGQELEAYSFENAKPSESCRLLARTIDGTTAKAEVGPGIINNTFLLFVDGKKPYSNMEVMLSPVFYPKQPEYWEIHVVGCLKGIALPRVGTYDEFLPLDSVRGTKGIEVVWANGETERFDVPAR